MWKTLLKALDLSSATSPVAIYLLKVQAILSDITVRRSAVERKDLKPYLKLEKGYISQHNQEAFYLYKEKFNFYVWRHYYSAGTFTLTVLQKYHWNKIRTRCLWRNKVNHDLLNQFWSYKNRMHFQISSRRQRGY